MLVDEQSGSLAAVIDGANVPDCKLLAGTIAAALVQRPKPTRRQPQHLCLDKGYDNLLAGPPP